MEHSMTSSLLLFLRRFYYLSLQKRLSIIIVENKYTDRWPWCPNFTDTSKWYRSVVIVISDFAIRIPHSLEVMFTQCLKVSWWSNIFSLVLSTNWLSFDFDAKNPPPFDFLTNHRVLTPATKIKKLSYWHSQRCFWPAAIPGGQNSRDKFVSM